MVVELDAFHVQEENNMKKILIVDDEPFILDTIKDVLQEQYEIATASNGEEAIVQVYRFKPDIIISDFIMPLLGGKEWMEILYDIQHTKNIPVVIMSGRVDFNAIKEPLPLMNKPFKVDALKTMIKVLLEE